MKHLSWSQWLTRLFSIIGMALVLSGIIYFFAFNWYGIPKWAKLALAQSGLIACLAGVWKCGYSSHAGQMLVLAASILIGVFLAVFGQIYQTGANTWQLFAAWAACITPWTLIARNGAQWCLMLVLLNTVMWLRPLSFHLWELKALLLNGAFLAAVEFFKARNTGWLSPRWLGVVPLLPVLLAATVTLTTYLGTSRYSYEDGYALFIVTVSAVTFGGLIFYFVKKRDTARLSLALLCCYPLIISAYAGFVDGLWRFDVGHFGVIGLILLIFTIAAARWLKAIHHAGTHTAVHGDTPAHPESSGHVEKNDTHTPDETSNIATKGQETSDSLPVTILLCIGGFLAAVFLTIMIEMHIGEIYNIHMRALAMLGGSFFVFYLAGSSRRSHLFGLSLSLALLVIGIIEFVVSCVEGSFWDRFLLLSVALAVLYSVLRHPLLRFVSAASWCAILLFRTLFYSSRYFIFRFEYDVWPTIDLWHVIIVFLMLAGVVPMLVNIVKLRIPPALRPAGYAFTGTLLAGVTLYLCRNYSIDDFSGFYLLFPANMLTWLFTVMLAVLFVMEWRAAGTSRESLSSFLNTTLAGIGLVCLAWLGAMGILLCLNLLLVGKARNIRAYTLAGVLFLPWFLFTYYYALSATLLAKSLILGGSGVVLLLAALHIHKNSVAGPECEASIC